MFTKEGRREQSAVLKKYQPSAAEKEDRIAELCVRGLDAGGTAGSCPMGLATARSVAWSVQWTAEDRTEIRPCRWAGGRMAIWRNHKPGQGKPIFSGKHVVRERMSVAQRLCTVCGTPVDRQGVQWIDTAGAGSPDGRWYNLRQTPFHFGCIAETIRSCPWVGTGMTTFAPYVGSFDVAAEIQSGTYIADQFDLRVHPEAQIVIGMSLQIPMAAFEKLERIAL